MKNSENSYSVISFDLQWTLSDAKFSDEFWLEKLPEIYSKKFGIHISEAKNTLWKLFAEYWKYDFRYYDHRYWLDKLWCEGTVYDIFKQLKNRAYFYDDCEELLKYLSQKYKLIIYSATTREFVDEELWNFKKYFDFTFSSLDDLWFAGKISESYNVLLNKLWISKKKMIHIWDSYEMDIQNAKSAGVDTFYFDKSISRAELINSLFEIL